jgi:hypothetical protein
VAGSLNGCAKRVGHLEETISGGGECPQCGQRDPRPGDTYEIVFLDDDEDLGDRSPSDEPEYCPACGRPTNYWIGFEDIDYKPPQPREDGF